MPPAEPARSDTRRSGSPGAPDSASPPRHRSRRTKAGAGTGSSSYRLFPLDGHAPPRLDPEQLIPPQYAAAAEATEKYDKGQNIAQRQQPQPARRQRQAARDDPGGQPAQQQRDQHKPPRQLAQARSRDRQRR